MDSSDSKTRIREDQRGDARGTYIAKMIMVLIWVLMMVMIIKAIDDYKRQQIVQIIMPMYAIERSKNHMILMTIKAIDDLPTPTNCQNPSANCFNRKEQKPYG